MRRLLTGICVLFLAHSAGAVETAVLGLPDQDFIVQSMRANFSAAKLPTLEELKFRERWYCNGVSALKEDYSSVDMEVEFAQVGHLVSDLRSYFGQVWGSDASQFFIHYVSDRTKANSAALRINSEGRLNIEVATSTLAADQMGPAAMSFPSLTAIQYFVCHTK